MYSKIVETATKEFVGKYGNDVIAAITDTGLFFQAVIAQQALESAWGKSQLAAKYNNFGGIKDFGGLSGSSGPIVLDTMETGSNKVPQPFATFDSPLDYFQKYVRVLQDPTKKYTSMGVFTAKSPEDQILAMARAGYTVTAPEKYLASLKGIIESCTDLYPYGKIESKSPNNSLGSIGLSKFSGMSLLAKGAASLENKFN